MLGRGWGWRAWLLENEACEVVESKGLCVFGTDLGHDEGIGKGDLMGLMCGKYEECFHFERLFETIVV